MFRIECSGVTSTKHFVFDDVPTLLFRNLELEHVELSPELDASWSVQGREAIPDDPAEALSPGSPNPESVKVWLVSNK